jgi:hypothetical protein
MGDAALVQAGSTTTRRSITRVGTLATAHPVATVFVVAFLLRVLVAIAVDRLFGGALIQPDSLMYHDMASQMADGATENWDEFTQGLYWRTVTFLGPLTVLYEVFGPIQLAGSIYVAALGAGLAALTTRLAMEALPKAFAIGGGLIVALLPSQVFWTSVTLKDGMVWVLLAAVATVIAIAARSTGPKLARLAVAVAVLLILLGYVRSNTMVVACWALAASGWIGVSRQRPARFAGAVLLWVTVPWLVGFGPAGIDLIRGNDISNMRLLNAIDAESAVVDPPPEVASGDTGDGSEPAPGDGSDAGDGAEPGAGPRPGTEGSDGGLGVEGGLVANLSHVPRGISVMLFEPYPWQSGDSVGLQMARFETVLWYPVLALAFLGLLGVKRYSRTLFFPFILGGAIVIEYALTEGNLGTAYRHRGEFVWIVALLAAFGMAHLRKIRSERAARENV